VSRTYRRGGCGEPDGRVRYVRRAPQPEAVSPEWAEAAMANHIRLWLDRAVRMGLFCEAEREEYAAMLNETARRAADRYRPEVVNGNGETSSPLHFVRLAVDNRMHTIAGRIIAYRRKYPAVPIVSDPPSEAVRKGCISDEDARLSDRCRSIRELEFRMDVATLFSRLPPLCAAFLRNRIAGGTKEEASELLGVSLYMIREELIPAIRREAVLCGFLPRSMVEGERPWRKKTEKVSHDSPPDGV